MDYILVIMYPVCFVYNLLGLYDPDYFLMRVSTKTTGLSASGQATVVLSGFFSQGKLPPDWSAEIKGNSE